MPVPNSALWWDCIPYKPADNSWAIIRYSVFKSEQRKQQYGSHLFQYCKVCDFQDLQKCEEEPTGKCSLVLYLAVTVLGEKVGEQDETLSHIICPLIHQFLFGPILPFTLQRPDPWIVIRDTNAAEIIGNTWKL